jgi:hypothetical protein
MSDINALHVAMDDAAQRPWGTPVEKEIRRRVQISVVAYGYEIADAPIMDDRWFDFYATKIVKQQGTGHPMLDEFFLAKFSPMTGMWIHEHPELDKIAAAYQRYYEPMREYFDKLHYPRKPEAI